MATGPSLNQKDADACRGWPTIVVNDAYRLAPWADVLYACDQEWWHVHLESVRRMFRGARWTQINGDYPEPQRLAAEGVTAKRGLRFVRGYAAAGLREQPGEVNYGQSSGHQSVNLAYHLGARRMLLLGFDCGVVNRKTHWFGDHPSGLHHRSPFAAWNAAMTQLASDLRQRGVTVLNCAPKSHLSCFPKSTIRACLPPTS